MKKFMFLLFSLMAFSVTEVSAQQACCKPKTECKPAKCCPINTNDCCTTAKVSGDDGTSVANGDLEGVANLTSQKASAKVEQAIVATKKEEKIIE